MLPDIPRYWAHHSPAETEVSQIARKALPNKASRKFPFPTHTKKDRLFHRLGRSDSQFRPAETRFEFESEGPRIDDRYPAIGEVLDVAGRKCSPS